MTGTWRRFATAGPLVLAVAALGAQTPGRGGAEGPARGQGPATGLAVTQGQFRRLLLLGVDRHRHLGLHGHLAVLQRPEQQIQGHHLGQRGGVALKRFVAGVKNLAGGAVNQEGGILVRICGAGRHGGDAGVGQGRPVAPGCRQDGVCEGGQDKPGQRRQDKDLGREVFSRSV